MVRESLPTLGVSATVSRIRLESQAIEGDSPVGEADVTSSEPFPEYVGTREIPIESGRTTCQG